jgi:hypothetical protein
MPDTTTTDEIDDTNTVRVSVGFEIKEVVTCPVYAELDVPAELLDDRRELMSWLLENDEAWVDEIDPSRQSVEDRDVIAVKELITITGAEVA